MSKINNIKFSVKCDEENNSPLLVDNCKFSCILTVTVSNVVYQKDIAYMFETYLIQAYNDFFQRELLKTYVELSLGLFIEDNPNEFTSFDEFLNSYHHFLDKEYSNLVFSEAMEL